MSAGTVHFSKVDGVASVVFDRPEAHNAMTMMMYDQLAAACAAIAADSNLRVATFRGTGEAFVAGTDIREFLAFNSAEDGIAYEQRIDEVIIGIESLSVPTIAVVEGAAMGGGLAIATACDLRIATAGRALRRADRTHPWQLLVISEHRAARRRTRSSPCQAPLASRRL